MMESRKLVIVGSGPAGYSAAIYAARAQLEPVVLAGERQGGQLMLTTEVENYAGFSEGIAGPTLMDEMRKQAERFGAKKVNKYAIAVDLSQRPFRIWMRATGGVTEEALLMMRQDERRAIVEKLKQEEPDYMADAVVLATGASARSLGVPGEVEYTGRGVSYCAVCDAAFFREKKVVLVGGGDAAMEDALALVKFAKEVLLIVRGEKLRASKIMQDKVLAHPKVKVRWNAIVTEVQGDGQKVKGVQVKDVQTGEVREETTDGVFVAIGHTPITGFLDNQVKLNEKGYVVTRLGLDQQSVDMALGAVGENGLVWYPTMTSVEGVFAGGDNVDFRYRQAITAAGMGTMAALDVIWWLERNTA